MCRPVCLSVHVVCQSDVYLSIYLSVSRELCELASQLRGCDEEDVKSILAPFGLPFVSEVLWW
jgi:hypothetical protein